MSESRRTRLRLQKPEKSSNASLWMDKYLDRTQKEPNQSLVDQVVEYFQEVPGYEDFFKIWKSVLVDAGVKQFKIAHTLNRLAIDLGADSVLETNIALHHTYGVPYIPGSALKGLASHFADQYLKDARWRKGAQAHMYLFGTNDAAGKVTFFDALLIPKSGKNGQVLFKDVITVHHAMYYQSGNQPPTDWDGTTIIPFVTAYGDFLIGLAGPDTWVEKAYEILHQALNKEGIGAKTSSGYGRMQFVEESVSTPQEPRASYDIEKRRLMDETPPRGKTRGVVDRVVNNGQYGFCNPQGGGGSHFIHSSAMPDGSKLQEGQVLEYEVVQTPKGYQGKGVSVLLEK